MKEFRTKMTENGRIVIPIILRKKLHLIPGEDLIICIDDEEMRIFSVKHSLKKARQLVQTRVKNKNLVKELKRIRNKEADE